MGRIITPITIANIKEQSYRISCHASVDTGASHMVLPTAWKERLGDLESAGTIELELANQSAQTGEVCGPVKIQIEGFRHIYSEVLFVDMKPENGIYEPLIGYIVLEQSQAGVDIVGQRLVHIKRMDLKKLSTPDRRESYWGEKWIKRSCATGSWPESWLTS